MRKSENTKDNVLEDVGKEDNPKALLLKYSSIVKKANKLSVEGNQIEADNYSNLVRVTSNKYLEYKLTENKMEQLILEEIKRKFYKDYTLFERREFMMRIQEQCINRVTENPRFVPH